MRGWQRVWELLVGWVHAQGVTGRQDRRDGGGWLTGSVAQSILPILAISSSQILVSSSISWFCNDTTKGLIRTCNTSLTARKHDINKINRVVKFHQESASVNDEDVGYLLLQSLFQRLILHLLLPQTGGQRHVLWARLGTHLSDLLIGPERYVE